MAKVILDRFTVRHGKESRAHEWMRILNERIEECQASLGQEKMYFEAIFSEEHEDRLFLYWIEMKGEGGQ